MINAYTQNNEKLSIYDVFKKFGIDMNMFMRLPKDLGFSWNINDFIDMVKKNPSAYAIAYEQDGRLIINILNTSVFRNLISKTFININNFPTVDNNNKIYLFLDFNVPVNNNRSMLAMTYRKDTYGSISLSKMFDIFGTDSTKDKYLSQIGITEDMFVNVKLLTHQYFSISILMRMMR